MMRSRFSDEQVIGKLKEHQVGLSAVELCRKYGVSDATCYRWGSRYGGMEMVEAKLCFGVMRRIRRTRSDAVMRKVPCRLMIGSEARKHCGSAAPAADHSHKQRREHDPADADAPTARSIGVILFGVVLIGVLAELMSTFMNTGLKEIGAPIALTTPSSPAFPPGQRS
jgi:putative transposase